MEKYETFQTTIIDNTPYVLIFHDDNRYYLEEFEVKIQESESKETEEILIVYTNKYRIIACEDIEIETNKYDDVKKEHKLENPVDDASTNNR